MSFSAPSKTFAFDDPFGVFRADCELVCRDAGFEPARGGSWEVVDPSEYFVPMADAMSAEDLMAASDALLEDGVFEPGDWTREYVGREFAIAEGRTLSFTADSLARMAVKFGWAIACVVESAAGCEGAVEADFRDAGRVTPIEHLFIGLELRRRGAAVAALALHLGGGFESAVEFTGEVAELEAELMAHAAVARWVGSHAISIHHCEEKFTVLPAIGRICGDGLHVDTEGLIWMEALRATARVAPALFRQILAAAQEVFAFDKTGHEMATNEEDIRFLPEVGDEGLEGTFLGDARGRQLLHVTAGSILADARLAEPLRTVLVEHGALARELVAGSFVRHLDALRAG